MAAISKLSTGVRPAIDPPTSGQISTRLAETMAQGDLARFDTTNGTFTGANGTTTGEVASPLYILLSGGVAGESVTGVSEGYIAGFDLSGLAFSAPVYASDTDKTLADAAGTVSKIVGYVIPATGNGALPFDKVLKKVL